MTREDILWLRFAEDTTLPSQISSAQQKTLEDIFDPQNSKSHWCAALNLLKLKITPPKGRLIKWHDEIPYMNWNCMTDIVTGSSVQLIREAHNTYTMKPRYTPFSVLGLVKTHWKISKYLNDILAADAPLPETADERIAESLALGICLSALRQRLPAMSEEELAKNLRTPANLSTQQKATIQQIKHIQQRRTELSDSWHTYFPEHGDAHNNQNAPAYFWNTPEHVPTSAPDSSSNAQAKREWKGIGVSGRVATGRAVIIHSIKEIPERTKEDGPIIAIFPYARPETITAFPEIEAVLYGAGGVLAHACVIAREQNISCVTAIGPDFIDDMIARADNDEKIWLNVDPQSGIINIINESKT
jgi:phosphohistidine swiveling domain-containing protein